MVKTIKISPVSRIEGHAKITIFLDDSDKVSDIHFNVASFRGFEKFLEGTAVERLPDLTSRVCGICPHSHELASLKAIENALGVEISDTTKKLRELLLLGQFIESHALSVFLLSVPDFLAESPADRNVFSLAKENPDLTKKIFALRALGTMITNVIGRRQVHSISFIGGMPKPLQEEERNKLLSTLKSSFLSVEYLINLVKDLMDRNEDKIRDLGDIKTSFLSLSRENTISLYDGELRVMDPDGNTTQSFHPQDYFEFIGEQVESYSYMKFPILKSGDIFRVNCLARLNINDLIDTDQANTELEEFRGKWGRPVQPTLLNHYARAIEILYSWEKAIRLLEDPLITKDDVKANVSLKAGTGIGVVEAPRGTLLHYYEIDDKGFASNINLIVATQHNNYAINESIKQAAQSTIDNSNGIDEATLNQLEMMARAYDPCLSCGTHTTRTNTELTYNIELVNSRGVVIKKW